MNPLQTIIARAKKSPKKIVYPEGEDIRIITAATRALSEGIISHAVLLGNPDVIARHAQDANISLDGCECIDPHTSAKVDEFTPLFYELRKHKGISIDDARASVQRNLFFAGMCVRTRYADGFVGGSVNTTADTVRAALYTLGLKEGISTLSSFFIMVVPNCEYGDNGLFLYADCGVVPDPSPRQLANITAGTAQAYKTLFDREARCALLSYSTKGSAEGPVVEKVRKALAIVKEKYPDVIADGEMQVDAALCPDIAKRKLGNSPVAGKANVLIFPDLASGNIAYKLTERLANAAAIGPILNGLAYPANDLSRGCNSDDVFYATAITVLHA